MKVNDVVGPRLIISGGESREVVPLSDNPRFVTVQTWGWDKDDNLVIGDQKEWTAETGWTKVPGTVPEGTPLKRPASLLGPNEHLKVWTSDRE